MTATEPDEQMMRETLDDIRRNYSTWNQSDWRCGSTACFAGHVAFRAGAVWLYADEADAPDDHISKYLVRTPDGQAMHVADYAGEVLRINTDDADRLFFSDNTFKDLSRIVSEICA